MAMSRLIIQADDELLERTRRRAAERGVSIAQVVRDALEAELGASQRSKPQIIGKYRSGTSDTSRLASEEGYVPPPWRSS
jgi:hypothetical protein